MLRPGVSPRAAAMFDRELRPQDRHRVRTQADKERHLGGLAASLAQKQSCIKPGGKGSAYGAGFSYFHSETILILVYYKVKENSCSATGWI